MSPVMKKHTIKLGISIILLIILALSYNILSARGNTTLSIISPLSKTFSLFAFASKREPLNNTVYGYLPYWTINKAKYLQMDKLTDIAYFGLHIKENGDWLVAEDGELIPGYNQWKNNKDLDAVIAKAKKNDVNFALTIISHRDDVSDKFLDCRSCWENLANNTIEELVSKDIKDVNINFEYVEYTPRDKARQFTEFVEYMNERLDSRFGESNLVVSAFADSAIRNRVTIIEEIGKVADQVFIMAYDFHRPTSDTAGPVSPIGGKGVHAEYDIETMVQDYLAYIPPNKLLLGVPYYGYNWVVEEDAEYAKRISGTDEIGYSQSQTYEYIMETILTVKPELKWDELAKTPYFTYTSPETGSLREVYFDNVESLSFKYNLVLENNLAGIGIWALGYDGGYNDLWNLIERFFVLE